MSHAHIDTLSITGKITVADLPTAETDPHTYMMGRLLRIFPSLSRYAAIGKPTGRVNGYLGSFALLADGVVIGHVALGGNEGGPSAELKEMERGVVRLQGWQIYLNATGCAVVGSFGGQAWRYAADAIGRHGYRITRVDIAVDDVAGVYSVDLAADWYQAGRFDPATGRPPSCSQNGNWFRPDGRGRTLYVGRRSGAKLLRIYEKGKQLGDAGSAWVRWELELHHDKDRPLPPAILARPARYFAGGFPALAEVLRVGAEKIETIKEQAKVELEALVSHARNSYGKLCHVLRQLGRDVGEVLTAGVTHEPPRRLIIPAMLAGFYAPPVSNTGGNSQVPLPSVGCTG
jgi:phage replication initiation protein